jgi:hypothetical protein
MALRKRQTTSSGLRFGPVGLLLALLVGGCQQPTYPLIEQKCGTCHSADQVYQSRYSETGWRQVIHGMKIRGLELTAEEEEKLMTILLRDFSPE